MCHKKPLHFQDCKNCLEAAQIKNKINHLVKNEFDVDCLKESYESYEILKKLVESLQRMFYKSKLFFSG